MYFHNGNVCIGLFFYLFCNVHKVLKQINAQKLNKSYTTCIKSEERSVSPCLLVKEPRLLRRPIVTDGKRLVVGYQPSALKNIAKKYRRVCIS